MRTECNNLHIHKFPAFAVFKPDFGHETYHGDYQFIVRMLDYMCSHSLMLFISSSGLAVGSC